jgi:hypothetical protein
MPNLHLSLPSPRFYSQGDEGRFFACFYGLPEYVAVTGRLDTLTLELRSPLSRESFRDLIALFRRYEISFSHLRPVLATLSEGDRAYFRNPDAVWHAGLFGA